MTESNYYRRMSVKEYGNPKTSGVYDTNLGLLEFTFHPANWSFAKPRDYSVKLDPEYWLSPIELPDEVTEVDFEKVIEQSFLPEGLDAVEECFKLHQQGLLELAAMKNAEISVLTLKLEDATNSHKSLNRKLDDMDSMIMRMEDVLHGEEGRLATKARHLIIEVKNELKGPIEKSKFTEDDIRKAIEMAREEEYGGGVKYDDQEIIQTLAQSNTKKP